MDHARTMTQDLALTILARDGIAAIWQLQLAAAEVRGPAIRALRRRFWR